MPVYNLASKILCRVINVSLKAEPDTDEVFAQVTLLPESNVSCWLEDSDLLWAGKTDYGLRFGWFDVINFSKMTKQRRRKKHRARVLKWENTLVRQSQIKEENR